jgi:hypothetical protein
MQEQGGSTIAKIWEQQENSSETYRGKGEHNGKRIFPKAHSQYGRNSFPKEENVCWNIENIIGKSLSQVLVSISYKSYIYACYYKQIFIFEVWKRLPNINLYVCWQGLEAEFIEDNSSHDRVAITKAQQKVAESFK